jgi:lysophospholipase L1-like esterase
MQTESATWLNTTLCMLTIGANGRIHAQPWSDAETFHSDNAEQLAEWLRAKRGPTCPNDAELVDRVQALLDG